MKLPRVCTRLRCLSLAFDKGLSLCLWSGGRQEGGTYDQQDADAFHFLDAYQSSPFGVK